MKQLLSPWINDNGLYFRFLSGENPYLAKNRICLIMTKEEKIMIRTSPFNPNEPHFKEEFNWKEYEVNNSAIFDKIDVSKTLSDTILQSIGYELPKTNGILPLSLFKSPESQYNDLPVVNELVIRKQGGEWLGAAREHIKCHFRGGDICQWGSNQILNIEVAKLEDFAANVSVAAINEYKEKLGKGL